MTIELFIFGFIIILYGLFTTLAVIGINRLNQQSIYKKNSGLFFSIVVSARNEKENVAAFLREISKQSFSNKQFELIIIDDASSDNTAGEFETHLKNSEINYQLIKQPTHQGKKINIAQAISLAKGDVIITTDADVCYRDNLWLETISHYFSSESCDMLIMPIDFENKMSIISRFQTVENIALTAITAGYSGINQPFLCNGANLAFKKEAYLTVNGYEKHLQVSSGEDVFLLEDLKNINSKAIIYGFNKHLIIKTQPQESIHGFISQRLRWAYKAKYSSNYLNLSVGIIVMLANLIYLALIVALVKQSVFVYYLSIFALTKLFFDFLLLFLASTFLGRVKYMALLFPFECVYWIYALFIGIASMFVKPMWKGVKIN